MIEELQVGALVKDAVLQAVFSGGIFSWKARWSSDQWHLRMQAHLDVLLEIMPKYDAFYR